MNAEASATAWSSGRLDGVRGPPRVLFGRMYEDWRIELEAFRPGSRVFCIASAGCTAMQLAVEREVVAVDINPAQLDYAASRIAGGPMVRGRAETLMGLGRPLLPAAGWSAHRLRTFLDLGDPAKQVAMWRQELDTRRFRAGMGFLLSAVTLRAGYASPLIASLPSRFSYVMRARMERCFATHANRGNPFARALLLGELRDDAPVPRPAGIELIHSDAADYLEHAPPQSFDAFTLSNILDGANDAYRARLFRAVARAARPGAVAVLRSFGEPSSSAMANRAAADRSMLWGVVSVGPAEALA